MDESKSVDLATAEAPPAPQGATGAGSAAAYDVAAKADKVGGKAEDAKPHDAPATWKRSTVVPNATRLMVGEHEELALRTMQSRVTIDGFRARVLIDYVYENNTDRQLEATAGVLRAISQGPVDQQRVLTAIAESAVTVCDGGTTANSGCLATNARTCSPFSGGSIEQVI